MPRRIASSTRTRACVSPRWALRNCNLMRDRLTIVDLLSFERKWGDDDVESLLNVAAGMGAGL